MSLPILALVCTVVAKSSGLSGLSSATNNEYLSLKEYINVHSSKKFNSTDILQEIR